MSEAAPKYSFTFKSFRSVNWEPVTMSPEFHGKITKRTDLNWCIKSVRAANVLCNSQCHTFGDILKRTRKEWRQTRGCGVRVLQELETILAMANLKLRD
jgi:DNA-directed RNA polymerase alpha subunit